MTAPRALFTIRMQETVFCRAILRRDELADIIGCEPHEVEHHLDETEEAYGLIDDNERLLDYMTEIMNGAFHSTEDRSWSIEP